MCRLDAGATKTRPPSLLPTAAHGLPRPGIQLALIVLAVVALTGATVRVDRARHRPSPTLGRATDLTNGMLTLSLLPLCVAAMSLGLIAAWEAEGGRPVAQL